MSSGHIISCWGELTDLVDEFKQKGYLFRGQGNIKYADLLPKVGRVSLESGSSRKWDYTFEDEERAYNEFRKAARPYLSPAPETAIEWLAVAQHHGMPTRLLDWTESLLVAAYFAVTKTGTAGVIYCVHGLREIGAGEEDRIFEQSEVLTYHPPHISPRIAAQQSVFTLHPKPDEPFVHPGLQHWVIEQKACWPIKLALDAAGITPAVLFPGIDGLGEYLGWRYKWGYFANSLTRKDPRFKRP